MLARMPVPATSVRFAEAAHRLAGACRGLGLVAPDFRSPPADPAANRTLRRRADGSVIVAVRVRGRTLRAVVTDLVDGVIAANRLSGDAAAAARRELMGATGLPFPAQAA